MSSKQREQANGNLDDRRMTGNKKTARRRAYQRPVVITYDAESILREIGPAHGVYGAVPGAGESL